MIPIPEWLPDRPVFQGGAGEMLNVIPAISSVRPFLSLATVSTALGARCQGAIFVRKSDGSGVIFAGDATKLYRLSGSTFSDVSRTAGGAYACPADGRWSFSQFGSLVFAVNGVDTPQQFNVDSDTNFSAMAGSPPVGTYVATAGDFPMMGRISGAPQRVQWGAINNSPTSWASSATTMADQQDLPDGGKVQFLVGYEQSVVILQEFAIRRGTFVGPPGIWQFGVLHQNVGATIDGSVAYHEDKIFFVDRSGLYMMSASTGQLVPIGEQRVDRYFWAEVDQNNLQRVTAAVDPENGLYVVSYPAIGNGGTPNRLLAYQWDVDRFARVEPGDHEMIWSGATQQGYTLDTLDSVSGSIDALPFSLDSAVWTGIARRLTAGFDTSHKLGFFTGAALAATVDTAEAQLFEARDLPDGTRAQAQRAILRALRPMIDGGSPTVQVGTRNRQVDAVSFASAVTLNSLGVCRGRWRGRYHRARIAVPAASSWSHLYGVDEILAIPAGPR